MANLQKLFDEMNVFLADQLVLSMKIHNLHWNIKGENFFTLHEKMDEYYDETQVHIDEVAERLLMVGGQPVGNYCDILKLTTLTELADVQVNGKMLAETIVSDFSKMVAACKQLIAIADDSNDAGTADLFTRYLQDYEKAVWMLNSYLQSL
jgi:DNA-binding ferritin-like protein (oxidative damage protectant)